MKLWSGNTAKHTVHSRTYMGTRLEESQPNGLGFRGEIIIKVNQNFENE
jgi:hypothetical protein